MKKRSFAVMLLVLCLLAALMPTAALAAGDTQFSDVAADAWYAAPVAWAANGGITGGVGDGMFAPDRVTTRAEAVTFLYKAMGSPAEQADSNPFTDVSKTDWFYAPVMWAVKAGVTAGVSADQFGVSEPCTREQFVTFLYKAVGSPEALADKVFADVAADTWYAKPVQWAVELGVTAGVSADAFGVGDPLTRAQTVTFLYANDMKPALVHNYADLAAAVNDTEPRIKLASDFSIEGEETAAIVINYPVVLDGNGANIDFGFEILTGGVTIKNFNITTSTWGKAVCKNGKDDGNGNMTKGDCIAIEIHNKTDDPVIIENNTIVHDVFLNNNSSVYLADGTLAYVLNNNITTENKSNASFERGGIYIGSGTRGKIIGNTIDSAKTAMPMSPLGLTANLDSMTAAVEMPSIEIKDNTCESIYVTKMYTNGVLFGEDGYIKADDTDFGAREALEQFLGDLAANNSFAVKEGQLPADENVYVVSRLDLIYAGTPLKQASNYFEIIDGKLVEKAMDIPEKVETVKNYAELAASVAKKSPSIKLASDFSCEGEETAYILIDYPVVLDGNDAHIDFGFEVLTGGVTIKNFNITTSTWGKAVCKNGKPNDKGEMTRGDCIAIEIHNTTDEPVIIENNTIVHDVFLNNNSSIYLADGTLAYILNNNITTENKSNASYERGGIYIGSGTRGKIIGNTIDSAKTAMPMSPLGLTENLDKMSGPIAMPSIEIKDNTCESIYVTKMYTNGVLFGEDGYIKFDSTDYGAREALESYLVALAKNNTFNIKYDMLPEDENVYVVSRLDLIYAGTPLKQASNYFEIVGSRLTEKIAGRDAEVKNYAELAAAVEKNIPSIKLSDDFSCEGEDTAYILIDSPMVIDGNGANIDFGFEITTGGVTVKNFNITTSAWGKAVCKNGKPNAEGQMTRGDCIAIEIHNTTDEPVIIENNTIVHDVFLNNNSSIYLADGTLAHVIDNNITTENKSNASFERGGIYIGSGTRGKIIGNTIDSAKTAMPMSPLGLTANLDKMTEAVEMPSIEIKDNTCESIYVTKMYTNGVLFGEDGYIKADDTDFGAREALEQFLGDLAANNTFAVKEGQLPADENVYVVSRLDLIYAGTPLKQASNYFEIIDGKLVEGVAK